MTFNKLPVAELRRAADEDFALELSDDEKKNKELLIAALFEAGITFNDYLNAHPELREEYEPKNVVKSSDVTGKAGPTNIIVKDDAVPPAQTGDVYLIKMERENPLYEVGRYKFTKTHPYALVDAADINRFIKQEQGFRQATPDELQEYYS